MAQLVYEREGGDIVVTIPDAFTVADVIKYAEAQEACPVDVEGVRVLYGCLALVKKVEGVNLDNPNDIPLDIYNWLRQEILVAYGSALMPKKKTS